MTEGMKGCLPRKSKLGDGMFPVASDDFLIDEKEWPNYDGNDLSQYVYHIIDQSRQSSCCGCAGVGILMLARERQGLDRVVLSQAVPYHFGNNGVDGGMAIDTCLQVLLKHGAPPVASVDQYDWRRRNWPSDWEEASEPHKPFEFMDCPTWEHMMSMVLRGHPVIYGAKRHAVVRIARHKDLNSWGKDWGDNGIGEWADDREIRREIKRYGAWALRYATDPNNDGDLV